MSAKSRGNKLDRDGSDVSAAIETQLIETTALTLRLWSTRNISRSSGMLATSMNLSENE